MSHSLTLSKAIVPRLFLPIVVLWVLSACGQKGDLYLPKIPPSPNVMNSGAEVEARKNKNTAEINQSLPVTDSE